MPTLHVSSEIKFSLVPEDKKLSLCGTIGLGADGFSFVRIASLEKTVISLIHYSFDPLAPEYERAAAITDCIVDSSLNDCQLYTVPDCFIAIPSEIVEPDKEQLFDFFQIRNSNSYIFKEDLPWYSASLLSVVSVETKRISSAQNNFHYAGTLVYKWIETVYKSGIDSGTFVHVNANNFWIMIIKNKNLQLLNAFAYAGLSDFIYYLLGAIKNYPDLNDKDLYISGSIMPSSSLWQTLSSHFDLLNPMNPKGFNTLISQNPLHLIFPLIN